jgi:hypothetical protein
MRNIEKTLSPSFIIIIIIIIIIYHRLANE